MQGQRTDNFLKAASLVDQTIDTSHDQRLTFGVLTVEHLVIRHAVFGCGYDCGQGTHGGVQFATHFAIQRWVNSSDQRGQAGAFDNGAINAFIATEIHVLHAFSVVIVTVVSVVRETVVLFFRVVQHQAKAHPLTCLFTIRQRPHTRDHCDDPSVWIGKQISPRRTIFVPLVDDEFEVSDQEVGRGREIINAAITIAACATVILDKVGVGAITCTSISTIQVLTPKEKLYRVIAAGNVSLDSVGFVQHLTDQFRCDHRCVHIHARDRKGRVRNHVQRGEFVLIRWTAIRRVHVVHQTFVERPSVHFAFPVINNRVAEAEHFGLLVGYSGRDPCGSRCI